MSFNVLAQVRAAKSASRVLAKLSEADKNQLLEKIAKQLERNADAILAANALDAKDACAMVERGELSQALYQRLLLSPDKLKGMITAVRTVADLPDPAGRILARTLLVEGLVLEKVSCPLGLLAIIFESRPDAITQITSLAIKSGNGVILKGGSEVTRTMKATLAAIHAALEGVVAPDAVMGVYGRDAVATLLTMHGTIDLVIPRGSNALVQHIQQNTLIPVLGHADGVCHVYVDAGESFLPLLAKSFAAEDVRIKGCATTRRILEDYVVDAVSDEQWHTEYSDRTVAIRVVENIDAALDHIERFGSHHTEVIVTGDETLAKRFLADVDSANVYHNCSTRFADGYRYGFGAEVGISTSKMHARGPVGLEGLVTYKYKLSGSGQVVRDYSGPGAKSFLHKHLDV
jgi:glutamate-5-semialdehyde dehydrogenase